MRGRQATDGVSLTVAHTRSHHSEPALGPLADASRTRS